MTRVHIHPDRPEARNPYGEPFDYDTPSVAIVDESNEDLVVCRKVLLTGGWVLRQYRNPVPCGATHVLLPDGFAEWEVLTYE